MSHQSINLFFTAREGGRRTKTSEIIQWFSKLCRDSRYSIHSSLSLSTFFCSLACFPLHKHLIKIGSIEGKRGSRKFINYRFDMNTWFCIIQVLVCLINGKSCSCKPFIDFLFHCNSSFSSFWLHFIVEINIWTVKRRKKLKWWNLWCMMNHKSE